ncbi:GNAT family N-acetyltransferase [Anabaena sp. 4-3]|uniref:GNAT family N-acetyltransferase n=1 Tax=Anabaena sp. 4-3 TaxID=1811979 RepID=UPI00082F96DC|nr:GNAT family N-acetyltransferase [Anabaena sp. 4-3]
MYNFSELNGENASQYTHLTYPSYVKFLENLTGDSSTVAIGAELDTSPVGLILAYYVSSSDNSDQAYGQILSLFVVPEHRHQGLGKELLRRMETALKMKRCAEVELRYLSSPSTIALEEVLAQQNWSSPKTTALICYGSKINVDQTKSRHLVKYIDKLTAKLPQDYEIFFWKDLRLRERQIIEAQMETDSLVRRFNPFVEENELEPSNSLGLRYRDRVVGWVITHRIAPDTIRYTQMFVHPENQPLSRSTLLLAKAIHFQYQGATTKATFRVAIDNEPMVKFVHRRLAPYLYEIREARLVTKLLDTNH